jgi:hypothetical protein
VFISVLSPSARWRAPHRLWRPLERRPHPCSWCSVTHKAQTGFVNGKYLKERSDPDGWPRSYTVGKGQIVLHQPQFTEWSESKTIEAIVAAGYVRRPNAQPVFGVIGLKGTTAYDKDAGQIVITDIAITELNFSQLDRAELSALALETGNRK